MAVIQNPVKVCDQVFALIENLTHQIQERMQDPRSVGGYEYYLLLKVLGMTVFLRYSCVLSLQWQDILIPLILLQIC